MKGEGNQIDYGMRIYDPRIGKFLSVDPLTKSYPWYTPYQFAGNKPIVAIDLDGLEELIVHQYFNAKNQVSKISIVRYSDINGVLINNQIKSRDNNELVTSKNVLVFNFRNGQSSEYEIADQDQLTKTQQEVLNKNLSVRSFSYKNGGYERFSSDEYEGEPIREGRLISSSGIIEHPVPKPIVKPHIILGSSRNPGINMLPSGGSQLAPNAEAFAVQNFIKPNIDGVVSDLNKKGNITDIKVSVTIITLPGNINVANRIRSLVSAIYPKANVSIKYDEKLKLYTPPGQQPSSLDFGYDIKATGVKK